MAAKTKVDEAPFIQDGSLMHFPENRTDYSNAVRLEVGYGWKVPPVVIGPDWRPNLPFVAALRLASTCRGRSAAYFIWQDDAGREFPMFISDMLALIQGGTIVAGRKVTAHWIVTKRGANYGIRIATNREVHDA
jgi:hypothetical protein